MLDRTVAPPAQPLENLNYKRPVIFQGKLPIMAMADDKNPAITLELVFDSGRYWEQKPGVSFFSGKMILEGTSNYSSKEIGMFFEEIGSHIEIAGGLDYTTIKLYSLKKYFRKSLEYLLNLLLEPIFPDNEFETLRNIRLQNIRQQLAKNNHLATLKFNEALFGINHPYGRILKENHIKEIQLSDVIQYFNHQTLINPRAIISGDFDDQDIKMLESLSQTLDGATDSSHVKYESFPNFGDHEVNTESNQVSLRIGSPTIPKVHKDIHTLSVANMMLGGFFGSRLMKNIREDKGLTYGIHSHIAHLRNGSFWVISSEIKKGNEQLVKEEIQNEINNLIQTPPTKEEIELVRNYSIGSLTSSMDSVFGTVNLFKDLFLQNLSMDYVDQYISKLGIITSEDVSEVIQKYFEDSSKVYLSVS